MRFVPEPCPSSDIQILISYRLLVNSSILKALGSFTKTLAFWQGIYTYIYTNYVVIKNQVQESEIPDFKSLLHHLQVDLGEIS